MPNSIRQALDRAIEEGRLDRHEKTKHFARHLLRRGHIDTSDFVSLREGPPDWRLLFDLLANPLLAQLSGLPTKLQKFGLALLSCATALVVALVGLVLADFMGLNSW